MLLTVGLAKAQEATSGYDYATVVSGGLIVGGKSTEIYVSFSSGEFKVEALENKWGKLLAPSNQAAVLKYISQMNKDGWEVVSFSSPNWTYLLKRKQK